MSEHDLYKEVIEALEHEDGFVVCPLAGEPFVVGVLTCGYGPMRFGRFVALRVSDAGMPSVADWAWMQMADQAGGFVFQVRSVEEARRAIAAARRGPRSR